MKQIINPTQKYVVAVWFDTMGERVHLLKGKIGKNKFMVDKKYMMYCTDNLFMMVSLPKETFNMMYNYIYGELYFFELSKDEFVRHVMLDNI